MAQLTQESQKPARKTPILLIVITWGLIVLSFFPVSLSFGEIFAILLSLAPLPLGIVLVTYRNKAATIHGIIVLALWGITFTVGLVLGLLGQNPFGW